MSGTSGKLAVQVGNESVTVDPSMMSHWWQLELAWGAVVQWDAAPNPMWWPPNYMGDGWDSQGGSRGCWFDSQPLLKG